MNSGQIKLLAVAALLATPFVSASALFFSGWRPAGLTNHGLLIMPPLPAPTWDGWAGKWSLAFIHRTPCGQDCASRLAELQRVRLSLAQEAPRTQIVPLAKQPDNTPGLPDGTVILVDPAGRAMLRYAPHADARGMRADLARVLRYSRAT